MAKSMMSGPTKVKKESRRKSTGGAALKPIPIPNYLRASIGSCHDLCKYGTTKPQPKSNTINNRGNNAASSLPSKKRTSLPRTSSSSLLESSLRNPISRTRRSPKKLPKSQSEKVVEGSEKSDQEKIIHVVVVETKDPSQSQKEDGKMESTSNPRKLELKRGEGDMSWKGIRLRRVVSEGDSEEKRKECIQMGEKKVKDLVHTFETLITTPHFDHFPIQLN